MAYYDPKQLANEIWFYIETHYFGAKYIAQRCETTVAELKKRIYDWDENHESIEHALFCAGCEFQVSIADELYIMPSLEVCKGSYRHYRSRQSINSVIQFLNDVTGGGDVNCDDFYSIECVDDRLFIFAHRLFSGTHLIEINENCILYNNIEEKLTKQTSGFQGVSVLSSLSKFILTSIIYEFDKVDNSNTQDYYKAVDNLHFWANQFDYNYGFIKRKSEEDKMFFMLSDYKV